MNKRELICVLLVALASGFAGCGSSSSSPSATTAPAPQTQVDNFTVAGYPHQVYAFNTSAATIAIVFLHGGGGLNYEMAYDLGLSVNDAPPQNTDVDWAWLNANHVLAVFPQGQKLNGTGSATWNNWVMDSGQDDVGFLQALADYLRSHYGVTQVYLAGHSNGGMMANRMWCESPTTFDGYIAMAGPASTHYLVGDPNFGADCAPSVQQPYYAIVGGQDQVLDTVDPNNGQVLFDVDTWTINSNYINASVYSQEAFATYNNPNLIGEWHQFHDIRSALMCAGQTPPAIGAGSVSGDTAHEVITWTTCNGQLELQEVVNANHWLSHHGGSGIAADSLEGASGDRMVDLIMSFIQAQGG